MVKDKQSDKQVPPPHLIGTLSSICRKKKITNGKELGVQLSWMVEDMESRQSKIGS